MLDYQTALIAACANDEKAFIAAKEMHLEADAFTEPEQQAVWNALCANFSNGIPHSKVELSMRLREMCPDTADQTDAWLSLASAEVGDYSANDKWLAEVVKGWESRRKQEALAEVTEMAQAGAEPTEIARHLSDKLAAIEDSTQLEEQRIQKQRDAIKQHNEDRINGNAGLVTTGIDFIDYQCGKVRSHEFIVVGARPAVGKSALARELMMGPIRTKQQPVLMFTLEMPTDEVVLNLAATSCNVSIRNVENDFPDNKEKLIAEQARFADALGKFLHIRDDLHDIRDIEHAIHVAMRRHRPAMVIVDYLQLVTAPHLKVSREREVAHISRRFKLLANMHRVPMVVLCQLNRMMEQEDREPQLSDLRESGSLEQDADAVWFLHRPKEPKRVGALEERKFIQAKRRGGQVERFEIGFEGRFTKFKFEPLPDGEAEMREEMF